MANDQLRIMYLLRRRVFSLSDKDRADLLELYDLMVKEEDLDDRAQIASTLGEILFPEAIGGIHICGS